MPGAINSLHLHGEHAIVVADKAASRFNLRTLEYDGVLARAPLEGLGESRVYTSALFRRANTLAVSGWLGIDREQSASIYFYDAASGRLKGRIRGLQGIPNKLLASPDERLVVGFLGAGFGIRVWELASRRMVFADGDYGGRATDGCFLKDGRLVGISEDGILRIYDLAAKRTERLQLDAAQRPYSVACSPDGKHLAVGYYAAPLVEVYAVADWRLLARHHERDAQGNLVALRWENSGRTLLMGGSQARKELVELMRWHVQDGGRVEAVAEAEHVIVEITSQNGRVYFATGGGQVCVAAESTPSASQCSALHVADLRASNGLLAVSPNADAVNFSLGYEDSAHVTFSYSRRVLGWAVQRAEYRKPEVGAAVRRGWFNAERFRIGKREIHLDRDQRIRALASGHGVNVVGTDWSLDAYDDNGERLWRNATRAPVWAVNVAAGKKIVVAGLGDGTLRWYRLEDGREIVSLLPLKDRRRWIAWMPDGHYMASPDIDTELELVVDHGLDRTPQVQPLRLFRTRLNRPDRVLAALDELFSSDDGSAEVSHLTDGDAVESAAGPERKMRPEQATAVRPLPASVATLRKAAAVAPPAIALDEGGWSLSEGRLRIDYVLRSQRNAPAEGIRVLEDGLEKIVLVPDGHTTQDPQLNIVRGNHTLTLSPGTSRVSLQPFSRHGSGAALLLELGERIQGEIAKPRLLLLAIGVSNYPTERLKLNFAAKDALDVIEAFRRQEGKGRYAEVVARSLTDGQATRQNIGAEFARLAQEARPGDVVAVFIAGHAFRADARAYVFAPVDYVEAQPETSGIDHGQLQSWVDGINARTLLFLDTCHAGASWEAAPTQERKTRRPSLLSLFRNEVAGDQDMVAADAHGTRRGAVVFAASSGAEASIESLDWGNGAFTKALLEALHGKAEGLAGEQAITLSKLDKWISRRVASLTRGEQTPVFVKPAGMPDLELAVLF
jgi:WD40 repeat protein